MGQGNDQYLDLPREQSLIIYVMPARIAGGRLLLNNTIETALSEAAGHAEFDNETFLLNQMVGGVNRLFDSESRPN